MWGDAGAVQENAGAMWGDDGAMQGDAGAI